MAKRRRARKKPSVLRCPECRTRRKDAHLMTLHRLKCHRPVCHCMHAGYPHRPGSFKTCDAHAYAGLFRALLIADSPEERDEINAEYAWDMGGTPVAADAPCPF